MAGKTAAPFISEPIARVDIWRETAGKRAAQDSNSTLTSGQAERALLEETKMQM